MPTCRVEATFPIRAQVSRLRRKARSLLQRPRGALTQLLADSPLADAPICWAVLVRRIEFLMPRSWTITKLLAAALIAPVIALAPSAAAADQPWSISGSGWGHGVGMSQYGALEMARDGRTAAQILEHYYQGTTYDRVPDTALITVNIEHRVSAATMTTAALGAGGGAVTITVGGNTMRGLAGASFAARPHSDTDLSVTCSLCTPVASLTGPKATVRWDDDKTLISVGGKRYRDGRIVVTRAGTAAAVNVALEARIHDEYLNYVAEVPWSWPQEALRAQAAAARGYALVRLAQGTRAECDCHVYDTSVSQVFAGYPDATSMASWPRWVDAVHSAGSATHGYVVRHNGAIIQALYSSSSGGRTQNNEDVWAGTPLPYLRSVNDPWSVRPSNPRSSWTAKVDADTVAKAFGLPDVVRLDLSARTEAGAVARATATSIGGVTSTITGSEVRSGFGVHSAFIARTGERYGGADRYATAAAVAREVPASTAVLIASGEALVDATLGGPLAGAVQGPILLSSDATLPKATIDELNRRGASVRTAYVLGGTSVVPVAVERTLRERGLDVVRLGGSDRFATSRVVASEVAKHVEVNEVLLAEGAALADVVSSSGPAAALGMPILLTPRDRLHHLAAQALGELAPDMAHVVGGHITTSTEESTATLVGSVGRLSGPDRYSTAAAVVSRFAKEMGYSAAVVTSGQDANLIDALAASALRQPILFVRPTSLPADTRAAIQHLPAAGRIVAVGGTSAVSDAVLLATRRS